MEKGWQNVMPISIYEDLIKKAVLAILLQSLQIFKKANTQTYGVQKDI